MSLEHDAPIAVSTHKMFRIQIKCSNKGLNLGLCVFAPDYHTAELSAIDSYWRIYDGELIGIFEKPSVGYEATSALVLTDKELLTITLTTELMK